jgi:hypothetical protein
MIKIHKLTNQKMLVKNDTGTVSTLYVLDENNEKILEKNNQGHQLYNVNLEPRYKIAICLNSNLLYGNRVN